MNTLLASILAFVMTWTVENKSTVIGQGEIPSGVEVEYACSYQKGTVRAGDHATLTITGIHGVRIERVELYVRSNKSAGAGVISIYGDGQLLAQQAGTLRDWVGKYDNTEFHPVEVLSGDYPIRETLTIALQGTTNSLYVEKYVITYQAAPVFTVTLMNGSEVYDVLTEQTGGAGVVLPILPDGDKWHFAGGSRMEFWSLTDDVPELIAPTRYMSLTEDITLWAAWQYQPQKDTLVTHLQSGEYVYYNTDNNIAIAGTISAGVMKNAWVNANDPDQFYHIKFNAACDRATIQHAATGKYIGFLSDNLSEMASEWLVWHEGNKTAFYTMYKGQTYILWPNVMKNSELYAGLQPTKDIVHAPTALLSVSQVRETIYTCHPESGMGVTSPITDSKEIIVPFGIYEIHIRGGKKYLRLRN